MSGCSLHPGGGYGCSNCNQIYKAERLQREVEAKEKDRLYKRIEDLERRLLALEKLIQPKDD